MSDDHEGGDGFGGLGEDDLDEPRRLFERAVPEVLKRVIERAVHRSVEGLKDAPENIREILDDKMPKEAANYIYDQVDDTKKGVYRVVAKEIRDVLEHMNFADEIADVLTKLQFEINTTIRFVPNDQELPEGDGDDAKEGDKGGSTDKRPSVIPSPRVVSKVVMKARDRLRPKTNPPPKPTDE